MESERFNLQKKEGYDLYGSAALIKTSKGTLLFQLKDRGVPGGAANTVTTFGGKREEISNGHGGHVKELTTEAAEREAIEELTIPKELIKRVRPFAWQNFNNMDQPNRIFSVHALELVDHVTVKDLKLTEGAAIIEGTLEEVLARDDVFGPVREMLERNKERIEMWLNK